MTTRKNEIQNTDVLCGRRGYDVRKNTLGDEMFDVRPTKIIYCYLEDQPVVDDMQKTLPDCTTYRGLPTRGELRDWCEESPHTVVVLDDKIHLVTKSSDALHLFQTMVSHSNLTYFLLSLNPVSYTHLTLPTKCSV